MPCHDRLMESISPAPVIAFMLAIMCGVMLAVGSYVTAAVTGTIALVVYGLWLVAIDRGDDDRHILR
jgi:hypothetical protein